MQGVHTVYDIDLFKRLISAAAELADTRDLASNSLRVIADHIRSCAFLIVDGVMPSNEGRGYVLKRIIRRAIRHGYKLGIKETFFYKLVPVLEKEMGAAYPELVRNRALVERVLKLEEERFAETLASGMDLLEGVIKETKGSMIDGETVFKLYDTYGFPADLTADIARERDMTIDQAGFDAAMEEQRKRSQDASKFGVVSTGTALIDSRTLFEGYEALEGTGKVVALLKGGASVQELNSGDEGEVVLDRTPFYAESGGQVGDSGELSSPGGAAFSHLGRVGLGKIRVGDTLEAHVNGERRLATALNHTATHLLHAALRKVLGTHVQQKGSLVAPDRLRFDFSHLQAVTNHELREIERLVNAEIRRNTPAQIELMEYESAVASGAMALFGEKYEKNVRVLRIGDFSVELCGGTHVSRAGDIGFFKITSESGVAAGVRRIEAITGAGAVEYVEKSDDLLRDLSTLVRGSREDVTDKVRDVLDRIRQMEKEIRTLKDKLASGQGVDLAAGAVDIQGVKVVATRIDGADAGALRNAVDQLKSKLKTAVIVLGSVDSADKVVLVAGVTADVTSRIKAGELVGTIAAQVGGRGGGRPDFAQAGGNNPAALDAALAGVQQWVRDKLG
jgi:alanyl-tRNA synthetase